MADIGVFEADRRKWLPFDPDTEVLVRHINKEEMNAIVAKAKKEAKLSGQDIGGIINRRLGTAAVLGWRKIGKPDEPGFTMGGKPFPFNSENLALLMAKSLRFSNFVNESAIDAEEFVNGAEETKNA